MFLACIPLLFFSYPLLSYSFWLFAVNLCGCLSEPLAPRVIKLFPLRAFLPLFSTFSTVFSTLRAVKGAAWLGLVPERASQGGCGTWKHVLVRISGLVGHIINGYRPGPTGI